MNRNFRLAAALLLAVMLPIQGWAAACAQICARVQEERHVEEAAASNHAHHGQENAAALDAGEIPHDGHCGKSEVGAGKCCQTHVFLTEPVVASTPDAIPSFERHGFVARWTNFIPEEPSPPPIAAAPIA